MFDGKEWWTLATKFGNSLINRNGFWQQNWAILYKAVMGSGNTTPVRQFSRESTMAVLESPVARRSMMMTETTEYHDWNRYKWISWFQVASKYRRTRVVSDCFCSRTGHSPAPSTCSPCLCHLRPPDAPPDNHSPSTLSQVPMGPGGDAFPGPGWTELEGRSNRRLLPPIQRRVNANQVQISYPPNIFSTFYQFLFFSLPLPSSKYWGNEEEAKIWANCGATKLNNA